MGTDTPVLDVPPHVLNYLNEQTTLTLATASPTGMPRAATLTYANDGLALYVWTRPDTTTARHIDQNPVVSFAIDEYAADWRQTKGIQGSGEGRQLLNPDEIRHAVELFQEKFEALTGGLPSNISLFRITPTELQFIDSAGAGGQEAEQALGFDFRSDLVFAVFHSLPQEEVTTIASKLQTMEVDAGTVIVRQGAPADKFFIIVDGEVEVVRDDDDVKRTVASLKRGQFFGEMAILRDMPRTATVQAVTPTTLFALDRDAFRSLVAQSLGTTEDFDQVIQKRLNELSAGPGA
jgi:CRP-like cAMP-binding protein